MALNFVKTGFDKVRGRALNNLMEMTNNPDQYGKSAPRLFSALKRYASFVGVNPIFIKRADKIHTATRSLAEPMRFLKNFIKLEQGRPIAGFYDDFLTHLQTDEEIRIARELVGLQLGEATPGSENHINLQVQYFRLNKAQADDPEVISFVRENLERSIETRLKTWKRKAGFTRENALSALVEAKRIFDQQGKRFCLVSGTLLGAVREKEFISHDNGIDLGILASELSLCEIKQILQGTSFALEGDFENRLTFRSKDQIAINFYLCIEEKDHLVMYQGEPDIHSWYFSNFDLIEYDFLGHSFWIPENYEKNLEENFGNWRTKPLFFDMSYDVPARVYGQNTDSLLYLTEYLCKALSSGWRYWAYEPAKNLRDFYGIDYTDYFPKSVIDPGLPPDYVRRTDHPIVVIGEFATLQPHMIRILESAASLNGRVIVGVLGDAFLKKGNGEKPAPNSKERLAIVKSLRYVDDAFVEDHIVDGTLSSATGMDPDCIVIEDKYAPQVRKALEAVEISKQKDGNISPLKIVVFNENAACLTKDDGDNIMVRNRIKRQEKMDWKQIWQKKAGEHKAGDLSLEEILRVNGYDVKYAETNTETIRDYVRGLIDKLKLSKNDHLLEVGSGAGAISMPMIENDIKVTGLDICAELIDIAKKAMPDNEFFVAGAAEFDLERKDFDAALSQGVFQFFESEDYGVRSFLNMLAHVRPGGVVAVTDLLDKANEQTLMEERIKLLGEEEYQKKYVETGLVHQFYHRDTFEKAAKGKCSKFWIEDQFLDNATAGYKYNIFAIK